MALTKGNVTVARYLVLGPLPGDESEVAQALQPDQFRPFEDGMEEERMGWVDPWEPLRAPQDGHLSCDGKYHLALRVDVRKVDKALLDAHVENRIRQIMAEKDLAFVGKEARTSIQDEVKAELLPKVLPKMKVHEMVWDAKGGVLYLTSASNAVVGMVAGLFMKTFGCEIQPLVPLLLAGKVRAQIPVDGLMALDPIDLALEEA